MRTRRNPKGARSAFSLLDLIVVVAVAAIVFGMFWPQGPQKSRSKNLPCMQNLRQVGMAMQMVSDDNGGDSLLQAVKAQTGNSVASYPGKFPAVSGSGPDELWKLYLGLHPYLKDPRVLFCPSVPSRVELRFTSSLADATSDPLRYYSEATNAFDYFLAVNATLGTAAMIIAGDSHLSADQGATDEAPGRSLIRGELRLPTDATNLRWTKSRHAGTGAGTFGDGHVEMLSSLRLRTRWMNPTNSGTRIWLPN